MQKKFWSKKIGIFFSFPLSFSQRLGMNIKSYNVGYFKASVLVNMFNGFAKVAFSKGTFHFRTPCNIKKLFCQTMHFKSLCISYELKLRDYYSFIINFCQICWLSIILDRELIFFLPKLTLKRIFFRQSIKNK